MPEHRLARRTRPHKRKARQAWKSERASVNNDNRIIPQQRPYDMARDDPEAWDRACKGVGAMLCIAWAVGMILYNL